MSKIILFLDSTTKNGQEILELAKNSKFKFSVIPISGVPELQYSCMHRYIGMDEIKLFFMKNKDQPEKISRFATSLKEIFACLPILYENFSSKEIDMWFYDLSIPEHYQLRQIIQYVYDHMDKKTPSKVVQSFLETMHANSRLVSPHGRKMGISPVYYSLKSLRKAFELHIQQLAYADQERIMRKIIKEANSRTT